MRWFVEDVDAKNLVRMNVMEVLSAIGPKVHLHPLVG